MNFNKAINFADNLVDSPTHLILMINSSEMESEELNINNISIRRLNASLNIWIRVNDLILTVPSDQVIKDYRIYIL